MSRSSRSFGKRVLGLAIALPTLRFAYDNRDWFQSVDFSSALISAGSSDSSGSNNAHSSLPDISSATARELRAKTLESLVDAHVDILVIGGGATGLFTALDAASRSGDIVLDDDADEGKERLPRPLRVALVEQADFGCGSTGSSTALLHSGFKRAQMALRQRDLGQAMQLARDTSELRILEKVTSSVSSSPSSSNINNDSSSSSSSSVIIRNMPTVVPTSSFTELTEFAFGSVMLFVCGLLGGMLHLAYPITTTSVYNSVSQRIAAVEKDNMWCGFVIPEKQLDGAALCRALARTATRHGATVANYCRVVGLDCAECPTRDPKATFGSNMSKRQLQKRHLASDGQPYPWFETGTETNYFMQEPQKRDTSKEDADKESIAMNESVSVVALEEGAIPVVSASRSFAQLASAGGTGAAAGGVRIDEDDRGPLFREEEQPFYSVDAVVVRDELSGTMFRVYPKYVINCAGAGSDSIRRMFPEKQKTLFERFSVQFHVIARHLNPASAAAGSAGRFGFVSPRNHVDAKSLFAFPYAGDCESDAASEEEKEKNGNKSAPSSSSSSSTGGAGGGENKETLDHRRRCWSRVGPADAQIEITQERFYAPERIVASIEDPTKTSPSYFHELAMPRITVNDLSFIATGADIFGVNIEAGMAHATLRVLSETWPGAHPPLARALRFGGSVDFRCMHQGIVHSVGTDVVWSRRKAEMMVDSFFIERCRGKKSEKVRIPACKTKTLALLPQQQQQQQLQQVEQRAKSNNNNNNSSSHRILSVTENQIRHWARADGGCGTVLDVMLRRMSPKAGVIECVESKKKRDETIDLVARVLSEEWSWSAMRINSEKQAARTFYDRNTIVSG